METIVKPFKFPASPHEYNVTALRECPTPDALQLCDTPDKAAEYWRMHIATHQHFNLDCECLAVLVLNTRRKVKAIRRFPAWTDFSAVGYDTDFCIPYRWEYPRSCGGI